MPDIQLRNDMCDAVYKYIKHPANEKFPGQSSLDVIRAAMFLVDKTTVARVLGIAMQNNVDRTDESEGDDD